MLLARFLCNRPRVQELAVCGELTRPAAKLMQIDVVGSAPHRSGLTAGAKLADPPFPLAPQFDPRTLPTHSSGAFDAIISLQYQPREVWTINRSR